MIFEHFLNRIYVFASRFIKIFGNQKQWKEFFEFAYWRFKKLKEPKFSNYHYEFFFTDYFKLSYDFYRGKSVLDIGCGPRGSLEWAKNTAKRIGVDPLVKAYQKLGTAEHQMEYIHAYAENLPFPDNYFDVISSFNSLDHVEDVSQVILEITRVLKKGGLFLLISDVHIDPTVCEPSAFSWDITQKFITNFKVLEQNHYEGANMYKSIRKGIPFDHNNPKNRNGVLTLKLEKK